MRKRRKKNKKMNAHQYIKFMLKSDLVPTDKHSIKKLLN